MSPLSLPNATFLLAGCLSLPSITGSTPCRGCRPGGGGAGARDLGGGGSGLILYQVCQGLADQATLRREVRALRQAVEETGAARSYLLALDSLELSTVAEALELEPSITVLPAWEWLLAADSC